MNLVFIIKNLILVPRSIVNANTSNYLNQNIQLKPKFYALTPKLFGRYFLLYETHLNLIWGMTEIKGIQKWILPELKLIICSKWHISHNLRVTFTSKQLGNLAWDLFNMNFKRFLIFMNNIFSLEYSCLYPEKLRDYTWATFASVTNKVCQNIILLFIGWKKAKWKNWCNHLENIPKLTYSLVHRFFYGTGGLIGIVNNEKLGNIYKNNFLK